MNLGPMDITSFAMESLPGLTLQWIVFTGATFLTARKKKCSSFMTQTNPLVVTLLYGKLHVAHVKSQWRLIKLNVKMDFLMSYSDCMFQRAHVYHTGIVVYLR